MRSGSGDENPAALASPTRRPIASTLVSDHSSKTRLPGVAGGAARRAGACSRRGAKAAAELLAVLAARRDYFPDFLTPLPVSTGPQALTRPSSGSSDRPERASSPAGQRRHQHASYTSQGEAAELATKRDPPEP
jgi:hypothetical protein